MNNHATTLSHEELCYLREVLALPSDKISQQDPINLVFSANGKQQALFNQLINQQSMLQLKVKHEDLTLVSDLELQHCQQTEQMSLKLNAPTIYENHLNPRHLRVIPKDSDIYLDDESGKIGQASLLNISSSGLMLIDQSPSEIAIGDRIESLTLHLQNKKIKLAADVVRVSTLESYSKKTLVSLRFLFEHQEVKQIVMDYIFHHHYANPDVS